VTGRRIPLFDLDGTLIDSDEALAAPFVALGVDRADVTFGHVLADECLRLGISVDDYLSHYDEAAAKPFPGVEDLLAGLERWAVCSNKHPRSGRAELERLGWRPDASFFADAFDGPKRLEPVLHALELDAGSVLFVGDTAHDRACADAVGCPFVLAAWNPRA
jgi:HAD superfamily hydrolase (TIGR01549 family)